MKQARNKKSGKWNQIKCQGDNIQQYKKVKIRIKKIKTGLS